MELKSTWSCPSNIALVKYWGKKGLQLPANSSISFVLSDAITTTTVLAKVKNDLEPEPQFSFLFHGEPQPSFHPKILKFLTVASEHLSIINTHILEIQSSNSFPHSSGIASSASAMGALSLCLCSLQEKLDGEEDENFFRNASFLARLGSGSACRSVYPGFAEWGKHHSFENSSDEFAIDVNSIIHPIFKSLNDVVLLVETGEKSVSSTAGHGLLTNHPYAAKRFEVANEHLTLLQEILMNGDTDAFCRLVESEALHLHAMMMTSSPGFMLMKPETLHVIEKIRTFREQSGLPVCFTLDAGANIHVLFPEHIKQQVMDFVHNQLIAYCKNGAYLCNVVGSGPNKLD